jgi:hypothetical protein
MKKKLLKALFNDGQTEIREELARVQGRLDTILTDITQLRIELHSTYEDAIEAAADIYSQKYGSEAGKDV